MSSDSGSDDSYYERMQEHAENRSINDEDQNEEVERYYNEGDDIDETEYFEKNNTYGANATIFLAEDSEAWQKLAEESQAPESLIQVTSTRAMQDLLQWLYCNLPQSSKVYGIVRICTGPDCILHRYAAIQPGTVTT